MKHTTRLLALIIANFVIVAVMLYLMAESGIDLENSRLIDNANSLWFVADFMTYLVVSFTVNIAILSYPSSKSGGLHRIFELLRPAEKPKPIKMARKHNPKQPA
jgi:hypothetical protein